MATSKKSDKPGAAPATDKPAWGAMPSFDDLAALTERFKLPGIDVSAIVDSQRKDLEALAEANRKAYEGMQALAQRRVQMLSESFQRLQQMATEAGGNPFAKGAEQAQGAVQQAIENFRELAEIEAEHRSQAWQVLQDRFEQNMANLQQLMKPKKE
jgi:phasin family protein